MKKASTYIIKKKVVKNKMIMPNEIKNLIHEYINKYGERPQPYNDDEWIDFDNYKKYLEKELNKNG